MEEKEGYEVVPCQNPQSLPKEQLGVQGKVGCRGDQIWEGYNSQGKNLNCSINRELM